MPVHIAAPSKAAVYILNQTLLKIDFSPSSHTSDTRSSTGLHLHINPLYFLARSARYHMTILQKIITSPKRQFFQHVIYTECM